MGNTIKRPESDQRRAALRAVVEAIAQSNPISGGLATIYRVTHPPKFEVDRERWMAEVTDRLNEPGIFMRYNGASQMFNVSSVTDSGVGMMEIHFSAASATRYYEPSVDAENATATVFKRSPNVVSVKTKRDDQACDDADFWVVLPSHTEKA